MIHYPTSGTQPHPSANQGTVSQFAWPVLKEPLTKDCLNRPQVGRQLCRGIGGKLPVEVLCAIHLHTTCMSVKEGGQPQEKPVVNSVARDHNITRTR